MAKQKQDNKMVKLLTEAGEAGVTIGPELDALLVSHALIPNRLATYVWEIRTKMNIPVESIRQGKKVIGYRLATQTVTSDQIQAIETAAV